MWNKKAKVKKSTNHYDTLISSTTHVMGDVHFSGGLHIDGKVKGTIKGVESEEAVVRISDVGEVKGDVIAPHIIVNGTVHGDVYASKHIELASEASIDGNVYYQLIEMAMGAEVNGKLVHQKDAAASAYDGNDKPADSEKPVAGEQSIVADKADSVQTDVQQLQGSVK
ncbi:MAG: cell shape determination protein CcmA [Gammaproteobacteria bacterium]|nr:MAG: cell shape determination protein CcmA [Gammaproteobacteria bacterium]